MAGIEKKRAAEDIRIFTYWNGPINQELLEMQKHWQSAFRSIEIMNEKMAREAIYGVYPCALALFESINLPACRSDVARLALLHQFGGIYVDAHAAPGQAIGLERLLNLLAAFEVIVFDREQDHKKPDDVQIINSVIAARPRSTIVYEILGRVIQNLSYHYFIEIGSLKHVPYNLAALTGSWPIVETLFDLGQHPMRARRDRRGALLVETLPNDDADPPIRLYGHYSYRKPGQHWSERQNRERLFVTPKIK